LIAADPVLDPVVVPTPEPVVAMPAPRRFVPATPKPGALFRTPEAAMRFLVTAYNHHDLAALKKVTTASARQALEEMRAQATDLRLRSCAFRPYQGDYECTFSHGFPAAFHRTDRGHATFTVAPADRPGWYMTVLEDCGG
jgi:hypothetical protein